MQRLVISFLCISLTLFCHVQTVLADNLEGFTEPFRQIDIAFAEAGVIDTIQVSEGEVVRPNQVLAELRKEVLIASLAVAGKLKDARGKLNSAAAELRQRNAYLVKVEKLQGHVSSEELAKAVLDKDVAEAQLLAVKEELEVRELEYQRIQEEIDRRRIRSPIGGVVTQIQKDVGEYASPTHPVVMTVVQLNPLMAVFSATPQAAGTLKAGKSVKVAVGADTANADAIVHFVSPVLDAQSGTVLLKIQIPNANGKFRSGDKCRLMLDTTRTEVTKAEPRKPAKKP
ncbi:MAG: macrolide transporter subunit [Planctomycetaceae bacterium]|nr:macrolide transporter subunit [Planctomycetaceae bacterium]